MLRRIKKIVPKTTLIKVYNAIILPHFDYYSLVWDNCSDYLIDKLQKFQNRAARVITNVITNCQLVQQICLISKQTYGIISVATTEISALINQIRIL